MNAIILIVSMFINQWGASGLIHPVLEKEKQKEESKSKEHKKSKKKKNKKHDEKHHQPQFRGWYHHRKPVDTKPKKTWYLETNLYNNYI